MMNFGNNTPLKSRPKKKRFGGTPKRIKKDNDEMSKQIVTKINDKIQTKFPYKKKLVYSDHHELVNFPFDLENQGTNACFFNSVMQILLSSLRNDIE